jgi:Flp pilus assembly protein TadD
MKRMKSEYAKKLFTVAQQQSREGDIQGVVKTMRELVQCEPMSGLFAAVLANALKSLGETDEAERYFRNAVALSPKSEKISLGLFHCLWGQEKRDEALEEMRRFMKLADSGEYESILESILKSG